MTGNCSVSTYTFEPEEQSPAYEYEFVTTSINPFVFQHIA